MIKRSVPKTAGMLSPYEQIALHAMRNLPDSLGERICLLRAILLSVPRGEVWDAAKEILHYLEAHDKAVRNAQLRLPLGVQS